MKTAELFTKSLSSKPVLWTFAAVTLVIAIMWPTARSVVYIWSTTETFTHGYLVFPAFLWLVWRKRRTLANLNAHPEWRVLPLVAFFGACWFVFSLSGIQVGEHTTLVLIIMSTIWASIGTQVATAILFPILFLFFLTPIGAELVPHLMELTADFTVWAIRHTGIPIYREGLYFSLPSGNWSVVEACSGINYLISSISLGSLYAYLSYNSYKTRAIFILIAAVLPIIANCIRAYCIVMLGHISDNKIATGVDHLIYGWLFFGIVMFLLFNVGSLLPDSTKTTANTDSHMADAQTTSTSTLRQHLSIVAGVVLVVGIWPVWSTLINSGDGYRQTLSLDTFDVLPQSSQTTESLKPTEEVWQPWMNGFDLRLDAVYNTGRQDVQAIAFVFLTQRQGKEMINSTNSLVRSRRKDWRGGTSVTKNISLASGTGLEVSETTLHSVTKVLIAWRWYQVGNTRTTSSLRVKLLETLDKLMMKERPSITYILVTDDTPTAQNALTEAANIILKD